MKKKLTVLFASRIFALAIVFTPNQEAKAVMAVDCKDGHESTGNQSWGTGSDRWKLKCVDLHPKYVVFLN